MLVKKSIPYYITQKLHYLMKFSLATLQNLNNLGQSNQDVLWWEESIGENYECSIRRILCIIPQRSYITSNNLLQEPYKI